MKVLRLVDGEFEETHQSVPQRRWNLTHSTLSRSRKCFRKHHEAWLRALPGM